MCCQSVLHMVFCCVPEGVGRTWGAQIADWRLGSLQHHMLASDGVVLQCSWKVETYRALFVMRCGRGGRVASYRLHRRRGQLQVKAMKRWGNVHLYVCNTPMYAKMIKSHQKIFSYQFQESTSFKNIFISSTGSKIMFSDLFTFRQQGETTCWGQERRQVGVHGCSLIQSAVCVKLFIQSPLNAWGMCLGTGVYVCVCV